MSDNRSQLAAGDPVVIVGYGRRSARRYRHRRRLLGVVVAQPGGAGPFPTDRGWAVRELLAGSRRERFQSRSMTRGGFLTGATTFDPGVLRHLAARSHRDGPAATGRAAGRPGARWRTAASTPTIWPATTWAAMSAHRPPDTARRWPSSPGHSGHLLAGTALSVISGRIAYTLGLAGPALTLDSSCASALAAFHVAVRSVQDGDCDLALAGGVNVLGSPGFFVEFSKQHALSDDGHCRPYSAHASGTVWAEGAAMFVLQRKSAALRDGRRILAEVRGQRRQPGRPQRRSDRPQRRRPAPAVPAGHQPGRDPARRSRDGRGARHRYPAR